MLQTFISSLQNINLFVVIMTIIGYILPIPLAWVVIQVWHHYRNEHFISQIKWTLLEIQVPRDVIKTPAAMELIFSNAFYHKASKIFWQVYVVGAVYYWYSLEIVGIDGRVHFFIRTPEKMRNGIETQIYAQYPQAKVIEVEDYVFHVPKFTKNGNWHVWACEFKKGQHDAYPIKSWREWDEMKSGTKEEFKIDPLTPTIEMLGSLAVGQQVWMQIIIRPSRKLYHSHTTGKHIDIHGAALEEIDKVLKPYTTPDPGTNFPKVTMIPDPIKNRLKAIDDHIWKLHFDCGIRVVTLGRKDLVSDDIFSNTIAAACLLFSQFGMPGRNQLDITNATGFSTKWADPTGLVVTKMRERALNYYRLRTFFHPPIQYSFKYPSLISSFFPSKNPQVSVLSIEEIATLFHFPGMVSETPSFKRLESKIAKPPSNLPS